MAIGLLAGLATLAVPITARIFIALGFSVVTITGITLAFDTLKGEVLSALGQGPLAALQLAGLGGAWIALGMIFGAVTFAASFFALTRATSIIGTGG